MGQSPKKNHPRKHGRKKFLLGVLLLVVAFLVGPRVSIKDIKAGGPIKPPVALQDLDEFLEKSEMAFAADLVPETRKKVFWNANNSGVRTPVSVVFLHGFSGSHMTLKPVPQLVASRLNANLYCNRYAGHGRKDASGFGAPMADATPQKWVDDTREALAIGRQLGDIVVVIANSTAAPMATWLASMGHSPDALVLLSPNFGPRDPMAETLLWPWGRQILHLKQGDTYQYAPGNIYGPDHRRYATTAYPSSALLTMMATVKLGRSADPAQVTVPTLCLYSERDQVVSPRKIKAVFAQFPHPSNRIAEVHSVTHKEHHVLAGDIMSKASTEEVVDRIVEFLDTGLINPKNAKTSPAPPE